MTTHSQYLWTGTAGSLAFILGAVPITQAFEVMEPYIPPSMQSTSELQTTDSLTPEPSSTALDAVALNFDLPAINQPKPNTQGEAIIMKGLPADWWEKGSDSPIAIAIGMAEGTRTLDGGKTAAYYWHKDPGNGANNFGTFSYQHLPPDKTHEVDRQSGLTAKREVAKEQNLPEESDRLQLQRLKQFSQQLQHQAKQKGIELSTLELLNGLDLANQSEEAALATWGYIDRLAQMRNLIPNQQDEQIKEARSWSYWNPDRNTWDAPGLGNTYENIRRDQTRRFSAIQQAVEVYNQPNSIPLSKDMESPLAHLSPEERIDKLLFTQA